MRIADDDYWVVSWVCVARSVGLMVCERAERREEAKIDVLYV